MIKLDPGFSSDPLSDAHSLSFDLLFSVEVKISEKQEMHRSASTPRVSDDYSKYHSSPPSSSSSSSAVLRALSLEADELPVLEPMSEVFKKEKSRMKLGETVVHIIPFVLLFCALVLWFFSNPDIDVPIRGDSVAARLEGLTLEGKLDTDSSQTGVLAGIDLGDLDPARHAM